MTYPIPLPAPVMMMTWPWNSDGIVFAIIGGGENDFRGLLFISYLDFITLKTVCDEFCVSTIYYISYIVAV